MEIKYDAAVYIGRFQPTHKAHISIMKQGLDITNHLIIALGTQRSAQNLKNPWSVEQRISMIVSELGFKKYDDDDSNHLFLNDDTYLFEKYDENLKVRKWLVFVIVKDYLYNDNNWIAELQQKVKGGINCILNTKTPSIILIGAQKDKSSYYLDLFPQWDKKMFDLENYYDNLPTSSTRIRDWYFAGGLDVIKTELPESVYFKLKEQQNTEWFKILSEENKYYIDYQKQFSNTPFPVIFTTTDVVLVKSGHVLLVRRKAKPGVNLLALPGGFLNEKEWLVDCALRELKEETRIKVDRKVLKEHIVEKREFDHPERSLRGRSITYAYYIKLPDGGELPEVKGGDDARAALWMPIGDLALHEKEFFEDHLHIITHFINR